jgi:hypothetical protein
LCLHNIHLPTNHTTVTLMALSVQRHLLRKTRTALAGLMKRDTTIPPPSSPCCLIMGPSASVASGGSSGSLSVCLCLVPGLLGERWDGITPMRRNHCSQAADIMGAVQILAKLIKASISPGKLGVPSSCPFGFLPNLCPIA